MFTRQLVNKNTRAVILAGGLGTRLYPYSNGHAKVLADINGRPFICFLLDMLARRGITNILMCLGYQGRQIEAMLGEGSPWNMQIEYSYDSTIEPNSLLGTAGAIRKALPSLGESFWVINGDTYLDIDYNAILDFYSSNRIKNLMVVYRNENRWWTSNVDFANGLIQNYNKSRPLKLMQYIDAGVAILSAGLFEATITPDLSELYTQVVKESPIAGYVVTQRFYEINTPESLVETGYYLSGLSGCGDCTHPCGRPS